MKKIALFVLSLALMLGVFSSLTAQNLLWTEDFGATAPTGWTVVNAGNGNDWSLTATGYPHTGSHHMQYGYNNYNPANTWAFTPGIFMTAGNDYYLTFYQRVRGSGYPENLKVTVGNAQTVASQTTTLLDLPSVTNTTYTQRTTAYYRPTTTNIYYFAFNCYSATNMWYLYVDLVQAYEIDNSGIANPTSFTATASSATQIDLSWALNSTPDNVLLAWNTTNTFGTPSGSYTAGDAITGGGTVLLANSSATSFNHTGLTPNTTYYYRIWSQNGAGPTYSGGAAANATTFMAPITSFPWTETFETTSSTRAGWSQIQETGTQSWTWATGSSGGSITTAHDGTLNARYTGSTYNGHITKLVTPTLDLSGVTNPTLSFWYGQQAWGSDQNTLAIYYRTSPTGAWTQIGSDYTSNISSWTQVTGIFLPNPSATYQLAFEGTDNYGYANVLDDVVVSGFSGVLDPTTFTATAVSSTQIDLSWVLNSTPDNVLLAWNTTNTFGTPSGSYTAGSTITGGGTVLLANSNATSYNHSGLNPNTTYYYMIWSQNGTGPTYSSGVDANATTPMAPVTSFPWAETFETTSSTRDGWSQIQETGTKSWTWATGSSAGSITTAHGGTLNARFTSSSGGPWVTKLVTPTLDLSGVSNPTLSFWYGQEAWYSDQNTLAIYYRTSPTGAWTQIGSDYTGNISSWTQVTGILLPNPSSTYQLAFEGTDNYGRANVLDDVVVSGFSGVLDPTTFTATAVSSTQIDLSWVLNSTPDNVLLAWNTTNTFGTPSGSYTAGDAITGGGTVLLANSSATNFNHSGLTPSTTYYYMIWSQNGAVPTYSNGVAANATTPMAPITSFPWTEDLTGVTVGSIPTGWSQTGTSPHWSAQSTNYAGGTSPEFRFYWSPGQTDTFRLITPPLDGSVGDLQLSFKHFIDYYNTPATYAVQYTTNGGATWNTLWSIVDPTANVGSITQVVDLSAINTVFQLAWVYDGNSYNTDNWYVDDISVSLAVPEITISESSYNFGLAFVNASNCTPRYFIAQNTGGGTATIASAPQFTGTDASQFTLIDTNTYPIALNASEYAYWGVKFEPSSYGEKTAYLSITDDTKAKGISFFTAEEIPAAAKGAKTASNPKAKSMDVLPATTVKTRATNNISLRGFAVGEVYEDYFDTYTDFVLTFAPWAQYDGDGSGTYIIQNVSFTNEGYTGSYIIFNPANTNPALTNINYAPYSGGKYAACFAADTPPNNDWLISPALNFGESPRVSFFARSVTDSYGLERFKVLYSTTGNAHTDFTNYLAGSATTYVEAPTEWTLYEYELPAACENTIAYIAIQCVSDDAFILMVDDFVAGDYYSVQTPVELSSFTASFTVGNYVNLTWVTQSETGVQGFYILRNTQDNLANAAVISPLVPATNTSQQQVYTYTDKELYEDGTYYYWLQNSDMDGSINYHGPVSIDYTVQGSSTPQIPLVTELKSVFPNPFNPIAYIPYSIGKNEGPADVSFRIYNSRGQLVFSKDVKNQNTGTHQIQWHGKDNNGNACGTGLYFVRMDVGGKSYTRKAVLMK